ncbi:hypothetical protein M9H77_01765 [Catharanthus roseus]|uniref:Uncharacterized protein n=1 Tax=Catharanthus roseus TaxID=4058 RepID=A0ACC0C6X1_CATRO|nr:hypothetical protein M9H77_01765 [Catharanthus roseus]
MLCRRYIDQNVLAKLTELIKDEEVASRFINGSWHKLLNEIDEQEYLRKLDVLKTKWQKRPDFLHYLFTTWLDPLAHKFVRVWKSQEKDMDMDSEIRPLTDLLHQISIGLISKVREMPCLMKRVLSPVFPEDSGSGFRGRWRPPQAPRARGRGRSRGRSNLSFVINLSPCSTFPYTDAFPTFIYPFIENWKNVISDGNCGYWVVTDFVFGDEHQ